MFSLFSITIPIIIASIINILISIYKFKQKKLLIYISIGIILLTWLNLIFIVNPLDNFYNDVLNGNTNTGFLNYINYFTLIYSVSFTGVSFVSFKIYKKIKHDK